MKAIWNNVVLAESDDTIIVEGNHYFPKDSLNMEYFTKSDHSSVCGWKGTAQYYSLIVSEDINENAAWYYPSPKPAAENITNRVAFWKGVEII